MVSELAQSLTDDFNKLYWKSALADDKSGMVDACYIARQLILELGRTGVLHDKMLDSDYPNKATLEKKNA